MFNFANRIDYAKKGWVVDDRTVDLEYRSHYNGFQCGNSLANAWISGIAHNANGETAKIWWYIPENRRGEDVQLEDCVANWAKCNDIESNPQW